MIDIYFGVAVWSTTGFLTTYHMNIGAGRRERVMVLDLPFNTQLMISFLHSKYK